MLKRQKVSEIQYSGMKYQISVTVFVFCCITVCTSLSCERKSKENCLKDCQWRAVGNKCIDCPDGYYEINCTKPCRYPNYGKNCQQDCSHCHRELCNSTVGCLIHGEPIDRERKTLQDGLSLPVVFGIFVGVSAVLAVAILSVISLVNRRFYTRYIRENAQYVGSVVSEHMITTLSGLPEQSSNICDENKRTDNKVYMLASSVRYGNVQVQ